MTGYHIPKVPLVGRADVPAKMVGKLPGHKIPSFYGTPSTDVWAAQAIGVGHQSP
jgi:hypothetical protein